MLVAHFIIVAGGRMQLLSNIVMHNDKQFTSGVTVWKSHLTTGMTSSKGKTVNEK